MRFTHLWRNEIIIYDNLIVTYWSHHHSVTQTTAAVTYFIDDWRRTSHERPGWPDWHFRCQIREIWHFEVGVGNQITCASLPTFLASIWHSPEIYKKFPKCLEIARILKIIAIFFSYFLDIFALLIQVILHCKIKVTRLLLCVSPDRLWEIFLGLRKFYH